MPRSKAAARPAPDPAKLAQARAALQDEFARPKATRDKYHGYLNRGQEYLTRYVASLQDGKKVHSYDLKLLATSFGTPNKHSADALVEFISDECCEQKKGKDTANGIVAAFCDYWDTMDDGRWSGSYHFHEDKVLGCPGRAPKVRTLIKHLEARSKVQGTRRHAEAMDIHALKHVVIWSLAQYPSERLRFPPKDDSERDLALKHVRLRALFVLGFILWTRNSELTAIKRRDVKQGCPSNKVGAPPHSKVRLHHRKGWQKAGGDTGITGIEYELHSGCDIPELDAKRYLKELIDYMELISGEPMKPDHLLFPYVSRTGAIHVDRQLTLNQSQSIINWAVAEAGLTTHYSTHCFRRGGAQYRFIYAAVRWNLEAVRWWGGWAEGERNIETLSKYLLNCEQKHSRSFADQILVGAAPKSVPATVEDLCALGYAISSALNSTRPSGLPTSASNTHFSSHPSSSIPPLYVPPGRQFSPFYPGFVHPPPLVPQDRSTSSHSFVPPASPPSGALNVSCDGNNATGMTFSHFKIVESAGATASADTETELLDLESDHEPNLQRDPSKLPESFIPRIVDLPRRGKGVWLKAIRQWTAFDPYNGCALCDWPVKWTLGKNRERNGMKRRTRRVVFEEFKRWVL
ncbi:hypothetical protein H0H93_007790 [Arthromyces matolae]|nr:hypothetical protein H0H93_007790 [Arthromyces matolae]